MELSFNNEVFANFSHNFALAGQFTVNGTVYNAANPSGSETFPNGSLLGCDSTVLINLSFFPPASSNISPELMLRWEHYHQWDGVQRNEPQLAQKFYRERV
ncbi:MAG: hypothetical protein R2788_17435 [Saprospiraceae bacterium]